jgi:hypothetical protein
MKILPLPTVEKGCIVDCDWDGEGIWSSTLTWSSSNWVRPGYLVSGSWSSSCSDYSVFGLLGNLPNGEFFSNSCIHFRWVSPSEIKILTTYKVYFYIYLGKEANHIYVNSCCTGYLGLNFSGMQSLITF